MNDVVTLRSGKDAAAAPVLLLHGLLGGPEAFGEVVSELSYPGAILAARLPGHGASPSVVPDGFEQAVAAIARAIARPALLVGYSLGGRLALGLAALHPRKVRGVIAVGAHLGIEDPKLRAERSEWERAQSELLLRVGLDAFVRQWEELPVFATQRELGESQGRVGEVRLARQRAMRLSHEARGIALAITRLGSGRMPLLSQKLAQHRVFVLMVAGERDRSFDAHAERASDASAHVHAHVVPSVGHNVALEAPATLAKILDQRLHAWSKNTLETSP
jgi:2-succinyl-6-hydroxy-2,4-cyclohexadiene-1-carboxylate synthase